jgi:hypothetical protein
MKKLLIAAVVLLLAPALTSAQVVLPEPIEGLLNPSVTGGISILMDAPPDGYKRVQPFLEASVPLLRLGDLPCSFGGLGLTAGALDPRLTDIVLGVSIPVMTCAKGRFVGKAGYAKIVTGTEKPDAGFLNVGFSLTTREEMAAKREIKAKKKSAKLLLAHPPGSLGT